MSLLLFYSQILKTFYKVYTEDTEYTLEFYISLIFYHFFYNSNWNREIQIVYKKDKHLLSEFARYRNFPPNELPISLYDLLKLISPYHVVMLIFHLLLEHKVILLRTQYKNNAIFIESLLQLLSPL